MPRNVVKQDEKVEKTSKKLLLRRLMKYMKPYKKEVVITLLLTMSIILVDLLNPYFLKMTIDDYIKNKDTKSLLIVGSIVIAVNIISMLCFKARIRIMLKAANQILMTIRQELYTHIQKLTFDFFDNRPAGKILARIVGDVNSLKQLFVNAVTQLIPNFVKMIAALVIMFTLDVRLALISLIMLPLLIVGMIVIEIYGHKRWQKFRQKNSNLNAFTHENFSGIRIVQSFSAEKDTEETFDGLLKEHRKSFMDAIILGDLFWPMVQLSWGAATVVVFMYGVNALSNGSTNITVGLLIAFSSYISMFWFPLMQLSNFYNIVITNMAGAERIFEILDITPDIVDGIYAKAMPEIEGNVKFDNVDFEYEEGISILENVNMDIKQGETIALVGPTGAGKTTIVNLISRFYDVKQGKVLIDGIDVKAVTIESLRSQMGIMTQDTFMFSGTIRENIAYGKLDATDEEIINAAKAVCAHEFILKLENGYDTDVNERGTRLSVGQRQLIALARALLANPKILILDEATSSIDTKTEKLVQQGIAELLKNRTAFVIAHRLSTIKQADRIMVVDDKGIKEEGTHKELLELKGQYYNLFMAQVKSISA